MHVGRRIHARISVDPEKAAEQIADIEVERAFDRICGTVAPEQLDRPATLRTVAFLLAKAAVLAWRKTA